MFNISELATHIDAAAPSYNFGAERHFTSFAIRPQDVQPGSVFFALAQPDFARNFFNGNPADSNPLIPSAIAAGAHLCVTRPDSYARHHALLSPQAGRLLLVDDVIAAMQKLANRAYVRSGLPAIGITGSAGKTTTKEMVAHILSHCGAKPLATEKNQNNGIGVPLTLLKLCAQSDHDIVVLEMGMSTPGGEIARLCQICPPTIAVILNVLPVHLEHLKSLDAVAQAKFELIQNMSSRGTAVLNADDRRVVGFRNRTASSVTFGFSPQADVKASDISCGRWGSSFTVHLPRGSARVQLPVAGAHQIQNALAAIATAWLSGIDNIGAIAAALRSFRMPPQRGVVYGLPNGAFLIDDTYNSNPAALVNAVHAAELTVPDGGRLFLVAGEMRELGEETPRLHGEAGGAIALTKVSELLTFGSATRHLIMAFTARSGARATLYDDIEKIIARLATEIRPGDVVLVKGSRSCRLERVTHALLRLFAPPVRHPG